ncbi:MAG: ferredoxin reductase family protein [Lysobacteraceae bacterium]
MIRSGTGHRRSTLLWLGIYLALVVLPLAVLLLGERPRAGGFWWDFAMALGYAALGMMGLQFALTARFKRATAPFGIDVIYYFHRFLAVGAFALLLFHAGIVVFRHPGALGGLDPRSMPAHMLAGWVGLLAFAVLIVSSLWRKPLRLGYDLWRVVHVVLAVVGVAAGLMHAFGSGGFLQSPLSRALWIGLGAFWFGLFVWVRLLRPAGLLRRPWRVRSVQPEHGRSWTLTLTPEDGRVFDYHPGQFAWLTLRASPFAMREHPFSFSSTPTRPGSICFTIKELGDFTNRIGDIQPGERAWVDGPYGSFGIDRHPDAPGQVFIAGGVGIAPLMSMLRALADRGDQRPKWLFYGNRVAERIIFREEIAELAAAINLTVVDVLLEPPADWTGERGYIDAGVLGRHLPADPAGRAALQYYVCGPTPMIRLAERALDSLGVRLTHVHSEIFDLA